MVAYQTQLANDDMDIKEATSLTRERAAQRQQDWSLRVDALYDAIEDALADTEFKIDRAGQHTSNEELAQRAGLPPLTLNILRIERPNGENAAILIPKGLWVIGANGRIDLRIIRTSGSNELYMLLDLSEAFASEPQWIRSRISDPFEREPFSAEWLKARLCER